MLDYTRRIGSSTTDTRPSKKFPLYKDNNVNRDDLEGSSSNKEQTNNPSNKKLFDAALNSKNRNLTPIGETWKDEALTQEAREIISEVENPSIKKCIASFLTRINDASNKTFLERVNELEIRTAEALLANKISLEKKLSSESANKLALLAIHEPIGSELEKEIRTAIGDKIRAVPELNRLNIDETTKLSDILIAMHGLEMNALKSDTENLKKELTNFKDELIRLRDAEGFALTKVIYTLSSIFSLLDAKNKEGAVTHTFLSEVVNKIRGFFLDGTGNRLYDSAKIKATKNLFTQIDYQKIYTEDIVENVEERNNLEIAMDFLKAETSKIEKKLQEAKRDELSDLPFSPGLEEENKMEESLKVLRSKMKVIEEKIKAINDYFKNGEAESNRKINKTIYDLSNSSNKEDSVKVIELLLLGENKLFTNFPISKNKEITVEKPINSETNYRMEKLLLAVVTLNIDKLDSKQRHQLIKAFNENPNHHMLQEKQNLNKEKGSQNPSSNALAKMIIEGAKQGKIDSMKMILSSLTSLIKNPKQYSLPAGLEYHEALPHLESIDERLGSYKASNSLVPYDDYIIEIFKSLLSTKANVKGTFPTEESILPKELQSPDKGSSPQEGKTEGNKTPKDFVPYEANEVFPDNTINKNLNNRRMEGPSFPPAQLVKDTNYGINLPTPSELLEAIKSPENGLRENPKIAVSNDLSVYLRKTIANKHLLDMKKIKNGDDASVKKAKDTVRDLLSLGLQFILSEDNLVTDKKAEDISKITSVRENDPNLQMILQSMKNFIENGYVEDKSININQVLNSIFEKIVSYLKREEGVDMNAETNIGRALYKEIILNTLEYMKNNKVYLSTVNVSALLEVAGMSKEECADVFSEKISIKDRHFDLIRRPRTLNKRAIMQTLEAGIESLQGSANGEIKNISKVLGAIRSWQREEKIELTDNSTLDNLVNSKFHLESDDSITDDNQLENKKIYVKRVIKGDESHFIALRIKVNNTVYKKEYPLGIAIDENQKIPQGYDDFHELYNGMDKINDIQVRGVCKEISKLHECLLDHENQSLDTPSFDLIMSLISTKDGLGISNWLNIGMLENGVSAILAREEVNQVAGDGNCSISAAAKFIKDTLELKASLNQ